LKTVDIGDQRSIPSLVTIQTLSWLVLIRNKWRHNAMYISMCFFFFIWIEMLKLALPFHYLFSCSLQLSINLQMGSRTTGVRTCTSELFLLFYSTAFSYIFYICHSFFSFILFSSFINPTFLPSLLSSFLLTLSYLTFTTLMFVHFMFLFHWIFHTYTSLHTMRY
jgi:hypothetical protein